jgi:hypothetical protein
VLVGAVVLVEELAELPPLPPQPATTTVAARTARIVSMAISGVLLMGRAPIGMRGFGRPPYQALRAPIALG